MAIHDSILDTIGRTPVVKLHRIAPAHVELYAKVEAFNPAGSVKDRLALAIILMLVYGALNNVGIGSYAPTMATVYALGLNPAVAFPVMMGACTFSVPVGASEFVRLGQYGRKITLFSSVFGIVGVLAAVYIVKSLNVSMLQWVVAAVVLYSGISLLHSAFTSPAAKQEA